MPSSGSGSASAAVTTAAGGGPLTLAEAKVRLGLLCASTEEPALSDSDLTDLLDRAARASAWTAATAYAVGTQVVSTDRNGRLYRCRIAGTSGSTEPDWGDADAHYLGRLVADGTGDLQWEDRGPAFAELWDLTQAARDGWLLKAARCAHEFYFASAGQQMSRQQKHDHCLKMAARYQPAMVF